MDIYCPVCGEPWAIDELHSVEGLTFDAARLRFRSDGCALFETSHNTTVNADAALRSAVLQDLLGDDIDGVASLLSD